MGALVGGTTGSARRWISAGWWCPPAPLQTHPVRDPGPISVPGSSLAQLHPPAWGAAVVSPGHPHIETRDMDAGLTHSKAAGRHGRETTVTPHSGQVGGQEESPPDPTCLTYSRRTPRALAVLHRDDGGDGGRKIWK